ALDISPGSRSMAPGLRQWLSVELRRQLQEEQASYRRKLQASQEGQQRQAQLVQRLQAKILQYKKRCSELEQQLLERSTELEQQRLRVEHSQDLESALFRLEEEQQRSASLAQVNAMLREQLDQAGSANQALSEDIRKVTSDWTRSCKELEQREAAWRREEEVRVGSLARAGPLRSAGMGGAREWEQKCGPAQVSRGHGGHSKVVCLALCLVPGIEPRGA
uniref:Rootletin-like coiled-coil domain-containing protein n=1 Tax=Spermophilus dauricus TaxID=99837 RepID=A0A8C9PW88_SPEDA